MTESVKATRASVQIGSSTVDGFMLPDGSYRMSLTQTAGSVGKPARSTFDFLRSKEFKQLQARYGENLEPIKITLPSTREGRTRVQTLTMRCAVEYWAFQASKGNPKALALVETVSRCGVANIPPHSLIVHAPKKLKKRATEATYAGGLQSSLGGECEVCTPVGKIDLLTPTELIEVKQVKQWKCAVGQVLIYSNYYPCHQKRIHLFGGCPESYLSLIEHHCSTLGILVTWEL